MDRNKVRFNLKNVHYAPLTFSASGSPVFAAPIPIPGAVSLSLNANGTPENFYADGGVFYVINNNMGYNGDLEIALIPQSFSVDELGEELDGNGVLIENSERQLGHFALLFEFDGDKHHIRHVLYNCTASRPGMSGRTNEANKQVQTETLPINAAPLPDGRVKGKTGDGTDSAIYDAWYDSVYLPALVDSVARLTALTLEGVTLTPAFSPAGVSYTGETEADSSVVTATGASGVSVAMLVNGTAHTSGEAATWVTGTNTVVVMVTQSGRRSTTYTVTITKT
jgi:phi13 family phage major tail protein